MTVASEKTDMPKLEAPKAETKVGKVAATVDAEEESVEPTKRTTKKEEPAPKKDLSKILSDWDDEE
jgi:hypothetical protein